MNASDAGRTSSYYRYRFGTVEFDEAKKELRVGGLPIEIERRPLQVLEYLLQHIGETVTKEELLREVWDNRTPTEQTLTNAIVKLRRALGEANQHYIVNQARVGYRISGPVERVAIGRRLASQISLAADEPVPQRPSFRLKRILGSTKGSEVWLAEHARTSDLRVYKFATHSDRLSGLKREATLSRLLHESLGPRPDIAQVIDWNFVEPPFFLECAYGGQNLVEWNKGDAPLTRCIVQQRIELFLQIARAVAAAHGVGVLHKDIKPANVLVKGHEGAWQLQLTDFGSSRLLEPDRLAEYGITQLGLTITQQNLGGDSTTGTPLYIAPELLKGQTPTVLSDVYSLGVMLYQFLIADFGSPMASGWERGVEDELLRDDIRQATDGEPVQRIASVAELIARLEQLEARRAKLQSEAAQKELAVETAAALARSRARRPLIIAAVTALITGCSASLAFAWYAYYARQEAERQTARVEAINAFYAKDVLGAASPIKTGDRENPSVRDILAAVAARVDQKLKDDPLSKASIFEALANTYQGLGDFETGADYRRKQILELESVLGPQDREVLMIRYALAMALAATGQMDQAKSLLDAADRYSSGSVDWKFQARKERAHAVYFQGMSDQEQTAKHYERYLKIIQRHSPQDIVELANGIIPLADAYHRMGRDTEVEELLKPLAEGKEAWGDLSPTLRALAVRVLGLALIAEEKPQEAEQWLRAALSDLTKVLGADNPRTLSIMGTLSSAKSASGDLEGALRDAKSVWAGHSAISGPESRTALVAALTVGELQYSLGEFGDCITTLEPTKKSLEALYKTYHHPYIHVAQYWLAASYIELGNTSAAAANMRDITSDALSSVSPNAPWPERLQSLRDKVLRNDVDSGAADPSAMDS